MGICKNHVYMQVTNDKYELPIAVSDNQRELSRKTGASVNTIRQNLHANRGKFILVFLEDDEEC